MAASADATRCRTLLQNLDSFLHHAKLAPGLAKPVSQARDQAAAHQQAGRHADCIASLTEAHRLLGRPVDLSPSPGRDKR